MVRKIRAKLILQLRSEGLSGRAIAASQSMSRKNQQRLHSSIGDVPRIEYEQDCEDINITRKAQ